MDPNTITPFIKSTRNIFEVMLQLHVEVGEPRLKQGTDHSHDISAIISFTGDVEGAVVLSFPEACAFRVVSLLTGTEISQADEDLTDAVGELVNMIAGGAKAQFEGKKIGISCPSVVIGSNHIVQGSRDSVCVILPCTCECGEFDIEITFKAQGTSSDAASSAAASVNG